MSGMLNLYNKNPIKALFNKLTITSESKMAVGYREMAEINLQLSEICFAAESEVLDLKEDSGE